MTIPIVPQNYKMLTYLQYYINHKTEMIDNVSTIKKIDKNENKCSAIILGAGKELIDKPHHGKSPPTSLLEDEYGESVLKWILNSLNRNNIEKISFVGGYEIESIGKKIS